MAEIRQKENFDMSNQSIVRGYLTAHRLWLYSAAPFIIFCGASYLPDRILPSSSLLSLAMILIAAYASIVLVFLNVEQSNVIAFINARRALNNGSLAIITYGEDKLRAIADAVARRLDNLGVEHFGSKGYAKHLVMEPQPDPEEIPPNIKSEVSEKCKLYLVIIPHAVGNPGILSIKYCLVDNGDQSVLFGASGSDRFKWPIVSCYKSESASIAKRPLADIAKEVVDGIFDKLNVPLQAKSVPTH